ncbi:MAG TPA: hypothetical protein VNH83_30450 [Bryobacteraceae bacterium]|nr:hypothetical protein [Bryobacteraceae bacterium]
MAVDIPARKAGPAAVILVEADTQEAVAIPVDKGIRANDPIPAVAAIPADETTTVVAAIPAVAAIMAVATMIADGDGVIVAGIVAAAASDSGTTPRLMRMAPTITTSRIIAIPTGTTISGVTGMRRPPAATSSPTGTNGCR